ncbi:MBL fold metallo-hydrolase [Geoalkalibacter halelectricus]|uniref:MBL fold metallo-hydrolase n=1 Tax=Geoalkalibacter halelectricus TaxID=2847045 RepID=A0ABY5ZPH9_9BACT|nr:MBL fold metallo-hydrolase [Geoalkalibacter halelectricus]MDO3379306.1 MBL fold metallo-hydrolase [Geoalkalibacter halelectricus]UWZ81062.1 MBL fold metallo-hydrolase [Geoalkalibacter halelectricus]
MIIERIVVGPLQVNSYILACPQTRQAAVIDPGAEGERILAVLRKQDLNARMVINTHGHFDHIGANQLLVEQTGADLLIHRGDLALLDKAEQHAALYGLSASASPAPSRLLEGGEVLPLGSLEIKVLATPGHSPGGICLLADGHLFTGDALFAGSIGRTDLPGGDLDQLLSAIREHLLVLPDETLVHPGHGPDTSIGREKRSNPFL